MLTLLRWLDPDISQLQSPTPKAMIGWLSVVKFDGIGCFYLQTLVLLNIYGSGTVLKKQSLHLLGSTALTKHCFSVIQTRYHWPHIGADQQKL